MDPTLLSLLETIPQKPPRSKLETHRELIRQLRTKAARIATSCAFFMNASALTLRSAQFIPSSRFAPNTEAGAVRTPAA